MIHVLCYGDSNTWGYRPKKDDRLLWEQRYPGILSKKLGAGYRIIENGLCGRTTCFDSVAEPYVNGRKEAEICAIINEPVDTAVIMLGTNDCKDIYQAEVEDIGRGLEQIGEIFERAGAKIVLAAPTVLCDLEQSPFYEEFGSGAGEKSKGLAPCYQRIAARRGWKFLNVDQVTSVGTFDRIHLDTQGHSKLAERLYQIILGEEEQDERKN